ncbi:MULTISPECIES: YheE family protein [Solibacillus]|uniref:YheE family protein n=1 Tax=Solibacillus merdavium TaxID=2762218 RepID=A0ABR8XPR0_9BACL|nr:YheE family protein [Solibacillus merdavium]MBD8033933.1 YheE family protein [Solibacillus merdavium]
MIQHFSYKPLFENSQIPGWSISFFFEQKRYAAEYYKDGSIQFIGESPSEEQREKIEKMIHELMLFHVYE